jgi:hypothetical protein
LSVDYSIDRREVGSHGPKAWSIRAPATSGPSQTLPGEAHETVAGEQPRQRQHRAVSGMEERTVDLAPQDRHLVAKHHDLEREVCVTAAHEPDQVTVVACSAKVECTGRGVADIMDAMAKDHPELCNETAELRTAVGLEHRTGT